jgi:hypothetical protein
MSFKTTNSLRRAQLVMPFGVGSVHMQPNGYSLVTAGLDDWFKDRSGEDLKKDQIQRVTIQEPRLAAQLKVDHFRLPPSEAEKFAEGHLQPSIPAYRFPTWFNCGCGKLIKGEPDLTTSPKCSKCDADRQTARKKPQIRFIAACDYGHLQEFPWLEWVHRSLSWDLECASSLTLSAKGGATLADIKVHCSHCKKTRSLSGITSGELPKNPEESGSSLLTSRVFDDGEEMTCGGNCAWHGPDHSPKNCGRPLRGILFNATNLHYSITASAIKIPDALRRGRAPLSEIIDSDIEMRMALKSGIKYGASPDELCADLHNYDKDCNLNAYDRGELLELLGLLIAGKPIPQPSPDTIENEEFHVFSKADSRRDEDLVMVDRPISNKLPLLTDFFSSIVAIEHLTETIAFNGFSRFLGYQPTAAPTLNDILWRKPPTSLDGHWLPAVQQTGEGIFLRFNSKKIDEWRKSATVSRHFEKLMANQRLSLQRRGEESLEKLKGPEYILIHTLSHLLINRLIFECGYGSASLKERIYADFSQPEKVAGLLIYTASGDSEGSMGGLVRLSKPETLERLLKNAISEAQWCSSDPVCKEASVTGSGPDSLNYAACHSCALLPETCCESFNSLLDRTVFIKGLDHCFLNPD